MLLRRSTVLAATVTCALLALPGVASAKDFCIGAATPSCGPAYYDDSELAGTLTYAQSNGTDDRVFIAPGVYTYGPYSYQSPEPIEIIGAGVGKTILREDAAGSVLTLGGNPDSSVRDLTIEPGGSSTAALRLTGTRAQGVAVDAKAAPLLLFGVGVSDGASFNDGSVDLGSSPMTAVLMLGGSTTVTDSRLIAPKGYGVLATGTEATVRRSTLDAKTGATGAAGHLTVSDTLIDLRGKGSNATGTAIGVTAGPDGSATTAEADLDRLTIVGSTPDTAETIGVGAGANGAGKGATIHLRDSVISGIGIPLGRQGINGATVNLSTDRSYYQKVIALDGGPGSLVEEHHLTGNPGFADAAGGDFQLAPGSQLVDAGAPGELPPGTADRDGNPRPSDGDGDGTSVTDVGAYELQGTAVNVVGTAAPGTTAPPAGASTPAAPVLSRLKVSPARIAIGSQLPMLLAGRAKSPAGTIGFTLSEAARVDLRFAKVGRRGKTTTIKPRVRIKARRGANRIRFAARLSRKLRLNPGVYKLTAIATDGAGARSKPATTRFTAIQPKSR